MRCSAGCGRPARYGVPMGEVLVKMLCWLCAVRALVERAQVRVLRPRFA